MNDPDGVLAGRLRSMIDAYQISQAIVVVAVLGVYDALADGPRSAGAIAQEVGVHPGALARLLHAAAAVGLLTHEGGEIFALTPLGHRLRRDDPDSVRAWAVHAGHPSMWAAWGHLLESVRSGESAFPKAHGTDVWDYRARHADAGQAFDEAMDASHDVAGAIVRGYHFGDAGCVVDVGGGYGSLLAAILVRHPALHGILLERPEVADRAGSALARAGVEGRCAVVPGDFFTGVPTGGGVYLLKGVLHDWDDDHARRILISCRRHMTPGSKLLVIERLVEDDADASARFMDLHMLVVHGGVERSSAGFARLLTSAGFALPRVIPTEAGLAILEVIPADEAASAG